MNVPSNQKARGGFVSIKAEYIADLMDSHGLEVKIKNNLDEVRVYLSPLYVNVPFSCTPITSPTHVFMAVGSNHCEHALRVTHRERPLSGRLGSVRWQREGVHCKFLSDLLDTPYPKPLTILPYLTPHLTS